MIWRQLLGWVLVVIVLAAPIVTVWLRRADRFRLDRTAAAGAVIVQDIKAQLTRIEQAAEVAHYDAQERTGDVLAKIRELKDRLSS